MPDLRVLLVTSSCDSPGSKQAAGDAGDTVLNATAVGLPQHGIDTAQQQQQAQLEQQDYRGSREAGEPLILTACSGTPHHSTARGPALCNVHAAGPDMGSAAPGPFSRVASFAVADDFEVSDDEEGEEVPPQGEHAEEELEEALEPLPAASPSMSGTSRTKGKNYCVDVIQRPGAGYNCEVKMEASFQGATPAMLFAVLTCSDISGIFRDIKRVGYRRPAQQAAQQEDGAPPGTAPHACSADAPPRPSGTSDGPEGCGSPPATPSPATRRCQRVQSMPTLPEEADAHARVHVAAAAPPGRAGLRIMEVEQFGHVKALGVNRKYCTKLRVEEDSRDPACHTVRFSLIESNLLGSFEGHWQFKPLGNGGKAAGAQVTMVQQVRPKGVPGFLKRVPFVGKAMRKSLQRTVVRMIEDLQEVTDLVNLGNTLEGACAIKKKRAGVQTETFLRSATM